mmetsp:Transcript_107208/g.300163  ORF Transcript_107208/g.300163 Transcript_107208/m.300163 type:complete len:282 (+) Transcript_107208:1776-2621(+)
MAILDEVLRLLKRGRAPNHLREALPGHGLLERVLDLVDALLDRLLPREAEALRHDLHELPEAAVEAVHLVAVQITVEGLAELLLEDAAAPEDALAGRGRHGVMEDPGDVRRHRLAQRAPARHEGVEGPEAARRVEVQGGHEVGEELPTAAHPRHEPEEGVQQLHDVRVSPRVPARRGEVALLREERPRLAGGPRLQEPLGLLAEAVVVEARLHEGPHQGAEVAVAPTLEGEADVASGAVGVVEPSANWRVLRRVQQQERRLTRHVPDLVEVAAEGLVEHAA